MGDAEQEISDHGLLENPNSSSNIPTPASSIDSYIDELLKNNTRTCTHTHTCNAPGPDAAAHTHTCYHTHTQTQLFPAGENDGAPPGEDHPAAKPRRAPGNREAVRKYREKKKAHTAYLEEEVKKLRVQNQQLIRKLEGQAILESEILRLRGLLVDLRGKIDHELGVFPFQNKCNAGAGFKGESCGVLAKSGGGPVGLDCENEIEMPCFYSQMGASPPPATGGGGGGTGKTVFSWEENCESEVFDCRANRSDGASAEGCAIDAVQTLMSSISQ